MIIEQHIFYLKFGKAQDAIALWKQISEELKSDARLDIPIRLLTDLTGPSYALIVELRIHSYLEINPMMRVWKTNTKVRELYQQFIPLCESASRELYKIEMET